MNSECSVEMSAHCHLLALSHTTEVLGNAVYWVRRAHLDVLVFAAMYTDGRVVEDSTPVFMLFRKIASRSGVVQGKEQGALGFLICESKEVELDNFSDPLQL